MSDSIAIKPFARFQYWIDNAARDTAGQMAVDEVLLRDRTVDPILRVYRWSEPALTTGYFEDAKRVRHQMNRKTLPLVRRFTGGGTVLHDTDLPYTIIIPKAVCDRVFGNDRAVSYRAIHQALAMVLQGLGIADLALAREGGQSAGAACFVSPVREDLIHSETGKKIAGAGQRRTREGVIHQGSIDLMGHEIDNNVFGHQFAVNLADVVQKMTEAELPSDFDDQWQALRAARYATAQWNRDVNG